MTEKIVHKSLNITLDLPLEWKEKIENLVIEKQLSLSELITDLIGQFLGYDLDDINISRLQENYQELNQRLNILEEKDYQIEKLQNRLDMMEKLVASLQSQVISRPLDRLGHSLMIDHEIEDEPDEILTDFLD
jgi:tetrahydromethanopterin S-methyltransferase subunit G